MRRALFIPLLVVPILTASCSDRPPPTAVEETGGILAKKVAPEVVVIPPTPPSSTPAEQLEYSMATISAFQQAVDGTPPEGRVIQLEAGLYDFSAMVILDASGSPPTNYSSALGGDVHWYNPHDLVAGGASSGLETGYGVVILGKDQLTIRGASVKRGGPTSVIRGCTDARCMDVSSYQGLFNIGFSVGGDYSTPSTYVTFEDISFENFNHALNVDSWDPIWAWSDPRLGVGTEDMLIQNNAFTDVIENFIGRRQLRTTIRDNEFSWQRPPNGHIVHVALLGMPNENHIVDALVADNTFDGGGAGIYLFNHHEGTTVRKNTIRSVRFEGILALAGSHGIVYPVVPNQRSTIEHNTIRGAGDGIAVFGSSGWTIANNEIRDAFRGIWTEWGPFNFSSLGIIQPTVAENNLVADNDVRFNGVGIFIGARGRNNTYRNNDVADNAFVGYFLRGPENLGWITFGPASGNTIIGSTMQAENVIDVSGCYPYDGGCPQVDEDGDGLFGEDPVDNANNDGDLLFGFLQLNDEDLDEVPNYITGMQAVYGQTIPQWASSPDSDGDGLKDSLERKLQASGLCVDPENPDTDGDGVTDSDEFQNGTLESCVGF